MKSKKYIFLFFTTALVFLAGCDQDFEEINENPYLQGLILMKTPITSIHQNGMAVIQIQSSFL
jgi:hypothetical protein